MNLLFDSNIVISIIRDRSKFKLLEYLNPDTSDIHLSFATIAEVESFAFRNNWTANKIHYFENFVDESQIIKIDDQLLKTYVAIDAYSQRKHPDFTSFSFSTRRNMGKHDLWIASTASLLNLQLVTTDHDFDHLHEVFLSVRRIELKDIRKRIK